MSSSPHAKTYETIWQMKQKDPNAILGKLCAKYKVSYQSYNNWVKRHKKNDLQSDVPGPLEEPVPDAVVRDNPKDLVTIKIPISLVIIAVRYRKKDITIPRDRVLEAMSEEDHDRVDLQVGRLLRKHGHTVASDDGEINPSKRISFDTKS